MRYLDWELVDAGKSIEDVRPIVDEIDKRVRECWRNCCQASARRLHQADERDA